jgi:hypothetical protein
MVMFAIMAAAAAATAMPSAEALSLGRSIAANGTLGVILPMMMAKENEELIAAHPELSAAERDALKAAAEDVYRTGYAQILGVEGQAWAERLSIEELRSVVAFHASTTGRKYRAVQPDVIAATVKALGEVHYKDDVLAVYCKKTGKLCGAQ